MDGIIPPFVTRNLIKVSFRCSENLLTPRIRHTSLWEYLIMPWLRPIWLYYFNDSMVSLFPKDKFQSTLKCFLESTLMKLTVNVPQSTLRNVLFSVQDVVGQSKYTWINKSKISNSVLKSIISIQADVNHIISGIRTGMYFRNAINALSFSCSQIVKWHQI